MPRDLFEKTLSLGLGSLIYSSRTTDFNYSKAFRRYCYDLGITNRYSTLAYPQENGQAEAVNKVIVS